MLACLLGFVTSQQHVSVSQGRICSDMFPCCHTETEVADKMFCLTQSQYTDTGPTSPSADPIVPGAWQGSHWNTDFQVTSMTRPGKIPTPTTKGCISPQCLFLPAPNPVHRVRRGHGTVMEFGIQLSRPGKVME